LKRPLVLLSPLRSRSASACDRVYPSFHPLYQCLQHISKALCAPSAFPPVHAHLALISITSVARLGRLDRCCRPSLLRWIMILRFEIVHFRAQSLRILQRTKISGRKTPCSLYAFLPRIRLVDHGFSTYHGSFVARNDFLTNEKKLCCPFENIRESQITEVLHVFSFDGHVKTEPYITHSYR
jgi:hypothetical protein